MFSKGLSHRIPVFYCGLSDFDLNLAFKVKFRTPTIFIYLKTFFVPNDKRSDFLSHYSHSIRTSLKHDKQSENKQDGTVEYSITLYVGGNEYSVI